jgi:hypothetical protein
MSRRTKIILAACAILAVALYAGAFLGGSGDETKEREESWEARITGLSSSVDPSTLRFSGDCDPASDTTALVVLGRCRVVVPEDSGIPLVGAARKLSFMVSGAPVAITWTVRGEQQSETVDPGESDPASVGFDADRQVLILTASPVSPANVVFTQE